MLPPRGTRSATTVKNEPINRPNTTVNGINRKRLISTSAPVSLRPLRRITKMFTQEPDSSLVALATATVECGASDLHLTVGRPATVRRDGMLVAFENVPDLTATEIVRIIMSLIDDDQKQELEKNLQLDFSFGLSGVGRFRANAFNQRGTLALALRVVPFRVRSLEELGAPSACTTLLNRPYGIVLVVGPTGSGKSTTLAAMIDRINETKPLHILTIEDPVEYLHQHKMAMVNQREVGTDVRSFEHGLKSALREDPDVVLLGEMRDLESMEISLSLAETGHLVFATLHTNDAAQALDRIIDVFPAERRDQIQIMLAGALQGVISQRLLPAIGGGRVAGYEIMLANEAIRNLVREGKSRQIRNMIATGGEQGMQTIEMDLARLVAAGLISMEGAARYCTLAIASPGDAGHWPGWLVGLRRVRRDGCRRLIGRRIAGSALTLSARPPIS
jgi:twitching motility protein PilT